MMDISAVSRSLLSPPPRREMPASRNPEDVIASRYLKRLGDTFICTSQKGIGNRLDESADDVAAAGGCRIGSRKVSLMRRHPSARNALYAVSTAPPAGGFASVRQDGDAAPTFAANRRWRQRVASLGTTSNGDHTLPPGSLIGSPNTVTKPGLPCMDFAHVTSVDDCLAMSRLHPSQAPGSTHRRRRGGSDGSAVWRTPEAAPGEPIGHPHSRDKGKLNQRLSHSLPCVSHPSSQLGSSICGSSLVSLDFEEWDIQSITSALARRRRGKATKGELARAEADSVVAQAAELMASTALPRRTLRGHTERVAQVLAQEHSKLLLLLGRRDNVESDIEDMLELADAARDKVQQERLNLLSMPTAQAESDAAVLPSAGDANPRDGDMGSGRAACRVNTAPSLDLASVRRQLRKLSTKLLRSGATDLDATQLRRLVDRLEDHLDMVAEILEEEAVDGVAIDSETQSLRVATGTPSAAALPRRGQALRQRLERAKKEQQDLLEASSNLTLMKWLVESADMELLTDMEQPQSTESSENRATGTGTRAGEEEDEGSALTTHEETATAPIRNTPRQSISRATLNGSSSTSAPIATTRELGTAELRHQECHRISLATTTSEPSMVPFSLTDLIGGSKASGSSTAALFPSVGGRQQQRRGHKDTSVTPSTSSMSHLHRLNLLSFMSEALSQCELERLNAAKMLKKRPLSSPSLRLQPQASSLGEDGRQQGLVEAEDEEAEAEDALMQSTGMIGGDDRARRGAGGSASGARRPFSSTPAAIATARGGLKPSGTANVSEKRQHSPGATPLRESQHRSTIPRDQKLVPAAKLHNLRSGLLHDLHELWTLHNYAHLIEARRRELTRGAGKGNAEYAAEVEQKLAEHRLQLEAMRRAREEAAALTQEWEQCSSILRAGSGSRPIASASSQRTVASEYGQGKRPNSGADLWSRASSSGVCLIEKRPSTAAALQRRLAEKTAPESAETELLREHLADKGLVFIVVGVRKNRHSSTVREAASAADTDASAAETRHRKKSSSHSVSLGGTSESDCFLYYELRVEKPLSAPTSARTDAAGATRSPPAARASAGSVAAVVHVSSRRLMNLKMTADVGVAMREVAKGAVVTVNITHGDPPRRLLTLTPAKPHKAVSYAQAFSFSAEDAFGGTEQRHPSPHEMWEVGSTASAVFAFPTGNRDCRSGSRSSSLDSRKVQPVEQTPNTTGLAAHSGCEAARTSKTDAAGQRSPKEPKKAAPPKMPGRQSLERARMSSTSIPAATTHIETARKPSRPGASASRTPFAGGVALPSSHATLNANQPSLKAPAQLPQSPPLSFIPGSIDEWGVPHAHTEMEAVEKNAVLLTVLQVGEEGDAAAEAAKRELGESRGSAAEQLLAVIPDREILSLVEGWRSSGADPFASERTAGREMAADAGTTSAVDAMAAEIIHQAMMDGADGETDAADGSVDVKGSCAKPGGFRDDVCGERLTNTARLATEEGKAAADLRYPPAYSDEGDGGCISRVASHEVERSVSPPFSGTDFGATQRSSSSRQEQLGGDEQATTGLHSGGEITPAASASSAPRTSQTVGRPAAEPRKMQAPLLTITSQARPLRATDVESYHGGLFRFDYPDNGLADASTMPPLPAAKPHPPRKALRKGISFRAPAQMSSAATAGPQSGPALPSQDKAPKSDETELETLVPPPVVMVERTRGNAKPHMLLPRQAAESLLGPSLRDMVRDRLVSGDIERHAGRQGSEGTEGALHRTIDDAPVSSQAALTAANSVLPTTGAAAAAAADAQTVSHIQKFMQAVKSECSRHGTAGGGSFTSATNKCPPHVLGGAAGLALRTELDQLQEDARELFMMDPLRYDTVISELMEQVARTLGQELAHNTSTPTTEGTGGRMAGAARALPNSGPFPALHRGEPHAGGGDHGSRTTEAAVTAAPFTQERPSCASFSVHSMLVQFETPEEEGDERDRGQGVGLRVSQMYLSSMVTRKRGSRVGSSPGSVSVVPPLSSRAVLASTQIRISRASEAAPGSDDGDGDQLLPSLMSLPPQPAAQRRDTHTLVMKDGAIDQAAAHRRASCADAAAEVERILYEQMKAQLLLRAIIAKMKDMWQTKQQHAEARHRERIANYRQRLVRHALAAAWPLERQRVIHLHKLIYLLDRQVGRVHGWLPHYSDSNILMGASSLALLSRNVGGASLPAASIGAHACLASWYRQRDQVALDAALDSDGVSAAHVCPRYLHYLPQRRMYHYMRLAKERRMLPLRLVRTDIHQSHSRHILIGYEKVALESVGEGGDGACGGVRTGGWPQRKVLRCRRGQRSDHAAPFQKTQYEDMHTRGERERYRRRLQRTAAFQSVSKMYSPRTRQDALLPFPLH
ncbi:hypothetical protein GH5_04050 [Leishmania sp. Ghana 2012 LV757]|uniref:hypothetical protein n=1 Tax=Leishmania sp. Ghana 2012 LV757 TaxID=2803181 RepID=UPI001B4B858A|nr:hypothetical protein GH5_04050 [Leishmania sp. Ghana 2012 LV757]